MVALKLANFGGMIPAADDRLLPDTYASLAQNSWLYGGVLDGFHGFLPVYPLNSSLTKRVYRIPKQYYDKEHIYDSYWMEFQDPDTDVIRSPAVNDSFERFYWASPTQGAPRYNTKARIINGDPSFILGIPAPTVAPTVTPVGGAAPVEDRAYVYTYESAYGEEGPPSPPTLVNGNGTATWNITVTAPGALGANRNITKINIYRTVTSVSGTATFYFVTSLTLPTVSYADAIPNTTVTGNPLMQSMFWQPPPTDLKGLTSMPNGITVGFREDEVWFTEPYRPHAWNPNYTLSVDFPIVGLGVTGTSLVVLTNGYPTAITGINPGSMSQARIAIYQPCMSRGSIVSGAEGVFYASPNGLALAANGTVQTLTQSTVSKDKWLNLLYVPTLRGARMNGAYYCWGSPQEGVFEPSAFDNDAFMMTNVQGGRFGAIIDFRNERVPYVQLYAEEPIENCWEDPWTGELLILRNGFVSWLDVSQDQNRAPYKWRSKIFTMPNMRNMEAMRIWFEVPPGTAPLNPVPNTALDQTLQPDQWGLVRVFADGRHVFTREIRVSGEMYRLPSGFKATYWQIEIEARVTVQTIEAATAAKELGSV